MPTILSHPAVPLALGLALGQTTVTRRLLVAGVAASILPDMDVLAFRLGIGYSHELGHRGFSHSLFAAAILAAIAASLARHLQASPRLAFFFVFAAAASHGLLDMLTNGGLGIALAWPFTEQRYFFPWQVIEVSPLSLHRFFSSAGAAVLASEMVWVWLPSLSLGLMVAGIRRFGGFHATTRRSS